MSDTRVKILKQNLESQKRRLMSELNKDQIQRQIKATEALLAEALRNSK